MELRLGYKQTEVGVIPKEWEVRQLAELGSIVRGGSPRPAGDSRYFNGDFIPWLTVAANRVLTGVTNVLYGSRITDMETCYKVMDTAVARSLGLESNRFDIEPEITAKLLRQGHAIVERPVRFEPRSRAQGKKIGWRDGVRALQVLVKYRWS